MKLLYSEETGIRFKNLEFKIIYNVGNDEKMIA
jgi:hypothetical protein